MAAIEPADRGEGVAIGVAPGKREGVGGENVGDRLGAAEIDDGPLMAGGQKAR